MRPTPVPLEPVDESPADGTDTGRHRIREHDGWPPAGGLVGGWVPEPAAPRDSTDDADSRSDHSGTDHDSETDAPDDADLSNPGDDEAGDLPGLADPAAADTRNAEPSAGLGVRRLSKPFGRFAELWVPEPLRDARVDPGRRGVAVLLLVAALAAVATAVGVWRDRPEPRPVETSAIAALAVSSPPATPSVVGGEPTTAVPADIVVSVTGLVGKPGVVTLPTGSRVADAIAAAGGAAAEADLTGMNLAAKLSDGDSVVVGSASSPGSAAADASGGGGGGGGGASADAAGAAGGLIDLNTADESALDTLPGVGPVMAQNILAWRETNGRFSSVEQLQEISGIGPSRYAQIAPLVTVS